MNNQAVGWSEAWQICKQVTVSLQKVGKQVTASLQKVFVILVILCFLLKFVQITVALSPLPPGSKSRFQLESKSAQGPHGPKPQCPGARGGQWVKPENSKYQIWHFFTCSRVKKISQDPQPHQSQFSIQTNCSWIIPPPHSSPRLQIQAALRPQTGPEAPMR